MTTVESIVATVNNKAQRAGQGPALVYSESSRPLTGVEAVEFTCAIGIPGGKSYEAKKQFMNPAEAFIDLTREGLLATVLYDLLNS